MPVLASTDEALDFLDQLFGERQLFDEWDPDLDPVEFGEGLATLNIVLKGPDFNGEITGEVARALAVYQDAIYAFAKVVEFGDENVPYTRLSAQARKDFEISIAVFEGSTDIEVNLDAVMKGIGAHIRKMNPKLFVALMISLAVVGAVGVNVYVLGAQKLENDEAASQRAHVQETLANANNSQQQLVETFLGHLNDQAKHEADHDRVYAKALVLALGQAQTTGMKEMARAAPQATSIDFGSTHLDKDDIAAINSRAPRTVPEKFSATGEFIVVAETNVTKVTKVTFVGKELPGEITVDFVESEFDEAKADAMWNAIRQRSPIKVKIEATIIRDTVKGGVLVDILPDE